MQPELEPNTSASQDKTKFYADLTQQIWRICPPFIIFGGTIGKYVFFPSRVSWVGGGVLTLHSLNQKWTQPTDRTGHTEPFFFSGNVLSAMVASRKRIQASTVSFFLRFLAVLDTVTLWSGLTRQWLRSVHILVCGSITIITNHNNFRTAWRPAIHFWFGCICGTLSPEHPAKKGQFCCFQSLSWRLFLLSLDTWQEFGWNSNIGYGLPKILFHCTGRWHLVWAFKGQV